MQITGVSSSSGGVDVSQLMSRMKKTPPSASDMAASLIKAKDSNGDGALSASESGLDSDQLSALDSDGNGSISLDELTTTAEKLRTDMEKNGFSPGMPPSGLKGMGSMSASDMASGLLKNSDKDGDSMLSISETKFSKDEFSSMDGNGDGKLSLDEITTDAEKRISEMSSQGPPPPPQDSEDSTSASKTSSNKDIQAFLSMLSAGFASSSNGSGTSSVLSLLDTRA
jgi:Ca2+-binding EF-hand superfamily protein